ncbi:GSCFA domain-containing protein [Ekhidna sp.]|uniref:GSCFA domain-containing protein n=1 Tax=Ekhidna sp. TaxID=2608089 RepID=UPI003296FD44
MFKLEFDIPEASDKINLSDQILLFGSCFSDEIGSILGHNKFISLSNPFGTIYNPVSIFKLLMDQVSPNHLVENQGVTYHWDTHGKISGLSEKETIELFTSKQKETQDFLANSKWLIITLGTAIVYELENGIMVANCHKVPATNFKKRFLEQREIIDHYQSLHTYLKKVNPDLKVVFTVSPVRHVRDGLIENNRSKAILINAIHTILKKHQEVSYFPSFEIVMDELRDYRFFSSDMIHLSKEATSYVWERFAATYFDNDTKDFLKNWNKLKSAIDHKPFQPESKQHQQFLKITLEKLESLNEKVDLSVEIKQLKKKLK